MSPDKSCMKDEEEITLERKTVQPNKKSIMKYGILPSTIRLRASLRVDHDEEF